ncbi:MAG: lytic murein transglycosylase, partial [Notoacmeibacter sp.]|nr:lytic murein transglycosylase [Notoacmeibacter sp.]
MRHLLTAFALVLLVSAPALARSQAVERQFRDWLANDLWPQARQRGVSAATFNAAFDGVTLNWKLPDLVPPGTRPETPRKQRQAEFG